VALGYADLGFALQTPDLLFCFARTAPGPPFLLVLQALKLPCIPGGYALTGAGLVLQAHARHCHGPEGGNDQRVVETRAAQDIRRYARSDQEHGQPVVEAGGRRWPLLSAAVGDCGACGASSRADVVISPPEGRVRLVIILGPGRADRPDPDTDLVGLARLMQARR
jgi:hypothetical protein